ncbi:MAG: RNA polymerase factor sigma-32 [Ferrovibrio sp.]|uniref:RNA polymerase factor sigma-32 n=1 Tax=Ferrovibrio sp. TaxID=1917215 RepID=UPI002626B708|nr:RNA polymerase factor sigma-32 [Ferrovibrio sp.]MCW0233588.1 RNA polymerase factor sigma-32 [Ferrovibrio sp.]
MTPLRNATSTTQAGTTRAGRVDAGQDEYRGAHGGARPDQDRAFVRRAMRLPLLSPEEEVALARAWREHQDQTALHKLVAPHMRLVISTAVRFRHYGLPVSDLIQEGNLGLMQAAARFEPEREVRFSTYAAWWIRAAIQDFVLRNWSIVRTGTTAAHKSLFFNLRRLRARIERGGPDALTPEGRRQLARQLNVTESDVLHMEGRLAAGDRSLNATLSEDGESNWQDMLVDDRPDPEAVAMQQRDSRLKARWLGEAMAELPERERRILQARFFSEHGTTLERLGTSMGISKERVRQLEAQALTRLRRRLSDIPGLQPH